MDPRYIFSALAGVFAVVLIFAAITTVRHISDHSPSATVGRAR
jgi:hypothetical protein